MYFIVHAAFMRIKLMMMMMMMITQLQRYRHRLQAPPNDVESTSHVAQSCYSVIGDTWSKPKFEPP